jgi:long-subunit fatty acid transport protein
MRGIFGASSMLGAVLLASPAQAQALHDDFYLQVSGFWATHVDSSVRVTPASNPSGGTQIDLESDLHLDNSEVLPAVFGSARLGGGFSIGAEYYSVGRNTSTTLARDITYDGVTYPANGTVNGGFNTDIYRLTVGWAFVRHDNFELGAAIGLHATNIEFFLNGQGTIGGQPVSTQNRRTNFLAPLPTIGMFTSYEIAHNLTLGARADFLSLKVGDYKGRLINLQANLAWRFTHNFGAGIAFRYVNYRVDVEKTDYVGRLDYNFLGPSLFLEVGF